MDLYELQSRTIFSPYAPQVFAWLVSCAIGGGLIVGLGWLLNHSFTTALAWHFGLCTGVLIANVQHKRQLLRAREMN